MQFALFCITQFFTKYNSRAALNVILLIGIRFGFLPWHVKRLFSIGPRILKNGADNKLCRTESLCKLGTVFSIYVRTLSSNNSSGIFFFYTTEIITTSLSFYFVRYVQKDQRQVLRHGKKCTTIQIMCLTQSCKYANYFSSHSCKYYNEIGPSREIFGRPSENHLLKGNYCFVHELYNG